MASNIVFAHWTSERLVPYGDQGRIVRKVGNEDIVYNLDFGSWSLALYNDGLIKPETREETHTSVDGNITEVVRVSHFEWEGLHHIEVWRSIFIGDDHDTADGTHYVVKDAEKAEALICHLLR